MIPDEVDEAVELSEKLTIEWIHAYMEEVDRIQRFFTNKENALINDFISLQDKFRIRTDL